MMRKIQNIRKGSTEDNEEGGDFRDEELGADSPPVAAAAEEEEVWAHFTKLEDDVAECNRCEEKVTFDSALDTLRGHLDAHHTQKSEETPAESAGEEVVEEKAAHSEDAPEQELPKEEDPPSKEEESAEEEEGGIWDYFVRLNKSTAQCKKCKLDLSAQDLKGHLRLEHPKDFARHSSPPKVSFSWQKDNKAKGVKRKRGRPRKAKTSGSDSDMDDYDNLQMDLDRINAGSKGKKSDNWMSYEKGAENNAEGNDNGEEAGEEEGEGGASEHETSELVSDSLQIVLQEESGGRPSRRRSNMWAHFVTLSKETARCRHCHKNLNYRSSATNLKRHLRVMHPEAHDELEQTNQAAKAAADEDYEEEEEEEEEEVMPTPKKRGRPSTSALLSKKRGKKGKPAPKGKKKKAPPPPKKKAPARKKKRKKVSSSEEESSEEEEESEEESEEEDSDEDSDEESSEEEYVAPEKERKSFTRIGEHNKVTHPKKKKPPKEVKVTPPAVPRERKPKKVHQKRKRSRLWDFFVKLDETYAECNACKCRLVWKSGLSNLAKHYSMKHSGKNQMTEIELAVNASLNPTDGQAAGTNNGGAPLKKRKKRQSENHWRCAIWKLFERKDDVFSQCRSCNKKISHRSTNANLLKHTRIKHPEIYFKFEERLKDFSHNVNILVDHFFPDTLIQPGGHHPPAPLAPEDHMHQQDYPMGGGGGEGAMYEPYSFPVIFVEEGGQHDAAQTSVITSANQLPPGPPAFGQQHMQGGHDAVNNNSSGGGTLSTPPPMGVEGGAMVPSGGSAPMPYHGGASGPPATTGPFNMSGNYQQVLTTSFNVSGGAPPNDRLIGMVEESNQLLRGMQTAIERQSDVLVRLAESIAGPTPS